VELCHLLLFLVEVASFLGRGWLRVLFLGAERVADALGGEVGAAD
jgi:hypothetical protein